jgi:hypothetical protein
VPPGYGLHGSCGALADIPRTPWVGGECAMPVYGLDMPTLNRRIFARRRSSLATPVYPHIAASLPKRVVSEGLFPIVVRICGRIPTIVCGGRSGRSPCRRPRLRLGDRSVGLF